MAPHSVRTGLIKRIHREIDNHKKGLASGIRIKINAIVDEACIDALYLASQAGVQVEIFVRGICAVRPGISGLSENIKVRSILGRFLEHSRAFVFNNGGDPEVWIGSADLMHRNLDRRVEALVRIDNPAHVLEVSEIFDVAFADTTTAWHLQGDGQWIRRIGEVDLQEKLIATHTRRQQL